MNWKFIDMTDVAPFVMSELVKQYEKLVIEILPNNLPQLTIHSTRLNNKLLSQIPDLQYFSVQFEDHRATA